MRSNIAISNQRSAVTQVRARHPRRLQKSLAVLLSYACIAVTLPAQQLPEIEPKKAASPFIVRPYQGTHVPSARLSNSNRLRNLVQAGKLYLTAQDAIALALENNIDLEIQRYNPIRAQWQVQRSEAGGVLRGITGGAGQAGTATAGQGVAGSLQSAGVSTGGGGGGGSNQNATVTQIGPVTPNLDPIMQGSISFAHTTQPQSNTIPSGVTSVVSNRRNYATNLQQGLLTGGNVTLSYNNSYLNENAVSNILNPSWANNLQLSLQHDLLQGFGIGVNNRFIRAAKVNLNISDLEFRAQVFTVVSNILSRYWRLVSDFEDVKAKENALAVAQKAYDDTKKQVEIGTLAPIEITQTEAELATRQQDLVISRTTLLQDQVRIKNALSRNGLADPALANVDVIPIDTIQVPAKDEFPPLTELVAQAIAKRPDIAAQKLGIETAKLNALGTQNGVLPFLRVNASASARGLAGTAQPITDPVSGEVFGPDPYFVGGVGTATGQIFRRNFPSQNVRGQFFTNIRNRQAQADYGIDQLQVRQTELITQRDINQVAVDVSNQVVGVQQARGRYDAAVQNRILQQQLLDAEQKKFAVGASTNYQVILHQRDFANAQSQEVAARSSYIQARVTLDRVLGTLLETNHISIDEALSGHVARQSVAPKAPPSNNR